MVGKWHLGSAAKFNPVSRGFEEYFGFLGGAHTYFPAKAAKNPNSGIYRGLEPIEEKDYLTDAFAREAVAYIDRHQKDPFFLYLTFNAVHTPMEATDKYLDRFKEIANERRQKYAGMMSAMDDAIGAVLDKLRKSGLEEDTLVFFISDNGGPPVNGSNNGGLHGNKAQTWEGGIRVPYSGAVEREAPRRQALRPAGDPARHSLDRPRRCRVRTVPTDVKLDGVNLLAAPARAKAPPPRTHPPLLAVRPADGHSPGVTTSW